MERYSDWFGPYAYPRLTLIDPPDGGQGAGGMEYPSLVTLGTLDFTGLGVATSQTGWERTLEMVAVHEIAHQWWQSLVATNEAEEPWLDEGFTDYAAVRLMQSGWGAERALVNFGGLNLSYLETRRGEYVAFPATSMAGRAWDFGLTEYGVATYSKPAMALMTLQNTLGEEKMNALMQAYFSRWQFGHPTAQDFQTVAVETTGKPLDWFFGDPDSKTGLVYGSEALNYTAKEIGEDWLTVAREGGPAIQVEIEVSFANGEREQVAWDEPGPAQTFRFDQTLRSFEIDPSHKIAVELAWADNGLSRSPDWPAWLAAAGRLVFRLQDWLLILGGI
jgi:aminopeptidase N